MSAVASLALIPPLALWFGYKELTRKDDGPWDPNKYSTSKDAGRRTTTTTTTAEEPPSRRAAAPPPLPSSVQHQHNTPSSAPSRVTLCSQIDRNQIDRGHHSLHKNEYRPWDIPVVTEQPVMPGARSNMGYSLFNDNAYRRDYQNDRMIAEGPFVNSMTGQVYQGYTMAPPPPTGEHHNMGNPRTLERLQGWGTQIEKPVRQAVNFRDPTMPEQRFLEGPNGIDARKQVALRANRDISMNMNGFTACEGGVQPIAPKNRVLGGNMTRHTPFMPATMRESNIPQWHPGPASSRAEANAPRPHWNPQADRSAVGRVGGATNPVGQSQAQAQPSGKPEAGPTNYTGPAHTTQAEQPQMVNLLAFGRDQKAGKAQQAHGSHLGNATASSEAQAYRNQHEHGLTHKTGVAQDAHGSHVGNANPLQRAHAYQNQKEQALTHKTGRAQNSHSSHLGNATASNEAQAYRNQHEHGLTHKTGVAQDAHTSRPGNANTQNEAQGYRSNALPKQNVNSVEHQARLGSASTRNEAPRVRSAAKEGTQNNQKVEHPGPSDHRGTGAGYGLSSRGAADHSQRTCNTRKENPNPVGPLHNPNAQERLPQLHTAAITTQRTDDLLRLRAPSITSLASHATGWLRAKQESKKD